MTRYFEDFTVGEIIDCGHRTVTKDEIIAFATAFDPQPFHVDEAAAARSRYGGLIASGWHSCCLCMRLVVDAVLREAANMGSPGMEKVRFLKPLRPGDTISAKLRVVEASPSRSKPDRGRLTFAFELHNQSGELIMDMTAMSILHRRTAAAAGA